MSTLSSPRVKQRRRASFRAACQMGSPTRSLATLVLHTCCSHALTVTAAWEGDEQRHLRNGSEDSIDDMISNGDKADERNASEFSESDWIMIVVLSLVFAFFVFFLGFVIGYVSILDDSVLRQYQNEGIVVLADVASADLARGRGRNRNMPRKSDDQDKNNVDSCGLVTNVYLDDPEYVAIVEYIQELSGHYRVRVRKQVRVLESDFIYQDTEGALIVHPGKATNGGTTAEGCMTILKAITTEGIDEKDPVDPEFRVKPNTDDTPYIEFPHSSSFYQSLERRKLNMLVMPNKPKSGYPLGQVERSQTLRYRLSTVFLVAFMYLLVLFCLSMAIVTIAALDDEKERHLGWIIVSVFATITVLLIPIIHVTRYNMLRNLLEEEYFESAEFARQSGEDDTTICTWGSDIYMALDSKDTQQ
jgi:uncharacterized Tic20 family protein